MTISSTFQEIIEDKKNSYGSLFECDCPFLNRTLPFRSLFEDAVLKDILSIFPAEKTKKLVYVAHLPGGLLFDFLLLNKLIAHNYNRITVIIIEPYLKKITQDLILKPKSNTILKSALKEFKAWFKTLKKELPHHPTITIHAFTTLDEYAQACLKKPGLKASCIITVDPDDKESMPHFEKKTYVKKICKEIKNLCKPTSYHATLYFQRGGENLKHPYRHSLRFLSYCPAPKKNILLIGINDYGETSFTHRHPFALWNAKNLLPFAPHKETLQIEGETLITHPALTQLAAFLGEHPELKQPMNSLEPLPMMEGAEVAQERALLSALTQTLHPD